MAPPTTSTAMVACAESNTTPPRRQVPTSDHSLEVRQATEGMEAMEVSDHIPQGRSEVLQE